MELSVESPRQHITWKVQDFFQLPSEIGYCLESPEIRVAGRVFNLRLYPNESNASLIELHLKPFSTGVSCKVGFRQRGGKGNDFDQYWNLNKLNNNRLALSRAFIDKNRYLCVPDGTFTVLCSMSLEEQITGSALGCTAAPVIFNTEQKPMGLPAHMYILFICILIFAATTTTTVIFVLIPLLLYYGREFVNSAVQTEVGSSVTEEENPKNEDCLSLSMKDFAVLSERMKELLIKGVDHDVTICVQDKEFRAHRSILSARSPVFAMMLKHDTEESNTGTINIEDCDPETFDEFLLYVYSGRTENLTPSNAIQLYYPADKYDFPELKQRCVSLLKTSLSVESFCDVVLLAAKHQEKELLEVATEFFARNVAKILVTVN